MTRYYRINNLTFFSFFEGESKVMKEKHTTCLQDTLHHPTAQLRCSVSLHAVPPFPPIFPPSSCARLLVATGSASPSAATRALLEERRVGGDLCRGGRWARPRKLDLPHVDLSLIVLEVVVRDHRLSKLRLFEVLEQILVLRTAPPHLRLELLGQRVEILAIALLESRPLIRTLLRYQV